MPAATWSRMPHSTPAIIPTSRPPSSIRPTDCRHHSRCRCCSPCRTARSACRRQAPSISAASSSRRAFAPICSGIFCRAPSIRAVRPSPCRPPSAPPSTAMARTAAWRCQAAPVQSPSIRWSSPMTAASALAIRCSRMPAAVRLEERSRTISSHRISRSQP